MLNVIELHEELRKAAENEKAKFDYIVNNLIPIMLKNTVKETPSDELKKALAKTFKENTETVLRKIILENMDDSARIVRDWIYFCIKETYGEENKHLINDYEYVVKRVRMVRIDITNPEITKFNIPVSEMEKITNMLDKITNKIFKEESELTSEQMSQLFNMSFVVFVKLFKSPSDYFDQEHYLEILLQDKMIEIIGIFAVVTTIKKLKLDDAFDMPEPVHYAVELLTSYLKKDHPPF